MGYLNQVSLSPQVCYLIGAKEEDPNHFQISFLFIINYSLFPIVFLLAFY